MSDAKFRGKVHVVEETKTYGKNGFRKRLVVLEQDNDRFTNYVPFDFVQDGCDTVDGLKVGDEVEVSYRLSGRKWQKDPRSEVKFFLNAEAASFQVVDSQDSQDSQNSQKDVGSANDALAEAAYDDEDIPF